jgi:hypothetical protein
MHLEWTSSPRNSHICTGERVIRQSLQQVNRRLSVCDQDQRNVLSWRFGLFAFYRILQAVLQLFKSAFQPSQQCQQTQEHPSGNACTFDTVARQHHINKRGDAVECPESPENTQLIRSPYLKVKYGKSLSRKLSGCNVESRCQANRA